MSVATFGLANNAQGAAATPAPWAACTSGLNVTGSPIQQYPDGAILYAVSAHSANDAWAVGEFDQPHSPSLPLLEYWNGSTWTEQTINLPYVEGVSVTFSRLTAVVTFSPTDAWAGGLMHESNGTYAAILFYWNGSYWLPEQTPVEDGAAAITALTGTNGGDLWIAEQSYSGSGASYLVHGNGTTWNYQTAPIPVDSLDSFAPGTVALGSSLPVFINGQQTGFQGELAQYQNGQWSFVADPGSVMITDLSGTGPNDVWAVGEDGEEEYVVQHYSNAAWTNVTGGGGASVVVSSGVDQAEAVVGSPVVAPGIQDAVKIDDPDGPHVSSLSSTPLTWDPSWGSNTFVRAIAATPRGALFAVGSVQQPVRTVDIQRGIVYRDCSS